MQQALFFTICWHIWVLRFHTGSAQGSAQKILSSSWAEPSVWTRFSSDFQCRLGIFELQDVHTSDSTRAQLRIRAEPRVEPVWNAPVYLCPKIQVPIVHVCREYFTYLCYARWSRYKLTINSPYFIGTSERGRIKYTSNIVALFTETQCLQRSWHLLRVLLYS